MAPFALFLFINQNFHCRKFTVFQQITTISAYFFAIRATKRLFSMLKSFQISLDIE